MLTPIENISKKENIIGPKYLFRNSLLNNKTINPNMAPDNVAKTNSFGGLNGSNETAGAIANEVNTKANKIILESQMLIWFIFTLRV